MKPLTWTMGKAKLGDLVEYEKNPVELTERDARELAKSIEKYPQVLPYIAAAPKNGSKIPLLDGHQRKKVSIELLNMPLSTVVDVRFPSRKLTDKERQELIIRLRKNTGRFDNDGLLNWFDSSDLLSWGFDEKELTTIGFEFEDTSKDAEPEIDRAAELLKKWKVRTGDMFTIGNHRLICGDCTDAATVARVMGGERARLIITSPPYAEQRKETYGGVPMDKYVEWWGGVQKSVSNVMLDNGSFFVNIKPHCEDGQRVLYVFDLVLSMVREWDWVLIDELCWVRQSMPNGTKYRFRNGFEPVYHFAKNTPFGNFAEMRQIASEMTKPKRYRKSGSGSGLHNFDYSPDEGALPDNVIMINTGEVNTGTQNHPATFPVHLPEFFVTGFSAKNDCVFEPFSGSGTTLVACENLSRRCRAIEISPAYVAVALERMATAFPHLKIEKVK